MAAPLNAAAVVVGAGGATVPTAVPAGAGATVVPASDGAGVGTMVEVNGTTVVTGKGPSLTVAVSLALTV